MSRRNFISVLLVLVLVMSVATPVFAVEPDRANSGEAFAAIERTDNLEVQRARSAALDCAETESERRDILDQAIPSISGDNMLMDTTSANVEYGGHDVSVDSSNGKITFVDGNQTISLNLNSRYTNIQKSANNTNTILMNNTQASYSTGVKVFEGDVRIYSVFYSSVASDVVRYTLEMPAGYHLALPSDTSDGSMLIRNGNGEIKGYIATPIAYDANGAAVEVNTTLNGNTFSYEYDLNPDHVTFPVVGVVPMSAQSDFEAHYKPWPNDSRGWIENYDATYGRCLAIFPKGGWPALPQGAAARETKWNAVYNYFSPDSQWYNTDRLYDQWLCHVNWGLTVAWSEWNLEPARPDGANIFNLCNPS